MPVKIDEAIPQQNFETISLFLASQLLVELDNQKTIQSFVENHKVFLERSTGVDSREDAVILNVLFNSMTLVSKNQFDAMYMGTYFIDVYTSGKAENVNTGDKVVGLLLMKYLGLCRYIFESHKVRDVINPNLKLNASVASISVLEPTSNQDTNFSRMGRISMEIKFAESQNVFTGIAFSENHTHIKLQDTDDGFQLILK